MASKKNRNSNPFLIGLFVIVGLSLVIATIIWLGANQFLKEQVKYVTYFDTSVEGLEEGSPVKYQGVPAGNVTRINVAPGGKMVEVQMNINQHVNINDSIRVQLTMSGITGAKFLQLLYPKKDSIPGEIRELPFKPPFHYIIATPSELEETLIAARDVVNNLKELEINRLNDQIILFLKEYQNFIARPEIDEIMTNLSNTTEKIESILSEADTSKIIRNLEISTNRLVTSSDDMLAMTKSLNDQVENMNLPEYVDKMYNRYDSTMLSADKAIQDMNFRAQNFLVELTLIIEELKNTNEDLQKSLRAISDAPSQIFLSEPPPEEK